MWDLRDREAFSRKRRLGTAARKMRSVTGVEQR